MDVFESGTQFDFSYAPGTSQEQILGFEMAGEIWSQYLADNVTVNIHVETTDQLPENVIGGALPGTKKGVKYDKLWKEMSKDITTWDDLTAFNNLADENEILALVSEKHGKVKDMKLTNANSKALDIIDGDKDKLDGYILMSDLSGQDDVAWDYDPLRGDGIADNELDFLSVALHEVGHVLGFTSGLDDGEWLNVVTEARDQGKELKDDAMKFATPLDLFRYSGNGQLNLSIGQDSYFSIDGGRTNLANFSTGEYSEMGGDGFQASHWQHRDEAVAGIMDPVLKLGVRREVSALDTLAMDVIGWNVSNPRQLDWQDIYANAVDNAADALVADRTKDVEKMIKQSETYQGRRSRSSRGGSGGSWQVGFWQNIKFQTLDVKVETALPEADITNFIIDIDNHIVNHSNFQSDKESVFNSSENRVDVELEVEATPVQLIEVNESDAESVAFEFATLDLDELGRLISARFEDSNLADKL